jgi:tRNA dimethylallyltransferase
MMKDHLPLIVILGPTAVGKTDLSIHLAKKINGEIVSADSRYFYRGMDIGTAKPTLEEREGVPHYLIDVADPDEPWSLGRFKQEAVEKINLIHAKGCVPLLVGGTGQYLRAITEGWVIPKLRPDNEMREVLNAWVAEIGAEGLYHRLKVLDPKAAENILPGNARRTIRALEVIFHTGKRFSDQRKREPVPYDIFQVGLSRPREDLFTRIDLRVDQMIEAGFVEEVATLLNKGYSPELSSMSAIGYRQLSEYFAGKCTLAEAIEETKRVTKKFVRRQMTWFKPNHPNIHWFEVNPGVDQEVEKAVISFLRGDFQIKPDL